MHQPVRPAENRGRENEIQNLQLIEARALRRAISSLVADGGKLESRTEKSKMACFRSGRRAPVSCLKISLTMSVVLVGWLKWRACTTTRYVQRSPIDALPVQRDHILPPEGDTGSNKEEYAFGMCGASALAQAWYRMSFRLENSFWRIGAPLVLCFCVAMFRRADFYVPTHELSTSLQEVPEIR